MRSSFGRAASSALAVAATLAVPAMTACKREPAVPPAPKVVLITAVNYAFSMPDTIPSGVTRLRLVNNGPELHHAALVRLTNGATMDSLSRFLSSPPGPPPAWLEWVGSPNVPPPGDTMDVYTDLTPGLYAAICVIPDSAGRPHFALGMVKALHVVAATGPAAVEPAADNVARLTDYAFAFDSTVTAGRKLIRVNNEGREPHEIIFARLDSGATAQALVTWIRAGMRGRPPATPAGGVVAVQAGSHTTMQLNLTPGTYGVYCFLPAPDGKEHVDHGMISTIAVN